jgi:hypothetical protein
MNTNGDIVSSEQDSDYSTDRILVLGLTKSLFGFACPGYVYCSWWSRKTFLLFLNALVLAIVQTTATIMGGLNSYGMTI